MGRDDDDDDEDGDDDDHDDYRVNGASARCSLPPLLLSADAGC